MKKFIAVFLFLSACAESYQKNYFVCDFLPTNNPAGQDFNGKMSYFDTVFYYEKKSKSYNIKTPLFEKKGFILVRDNILSASYQLDYDLTPERIPFEIFQFDMKSKTLIRSNAYYLSPKESQDPIWLKRLAKHSNSPLIELIETPPPDGFKAIAWQDDFWQCYPTSYSKYIKNTILDFLMSITA